MNTWKKSTSALLLLALLLSFSGCNTEATPSPEAQKLADEVRAAQQVTRDVLLTAEVVENTLQKAVVKITLANPSLQKIASVRSWLSFPTHILQGADIELSKKNPIALVAPGEKEFDNTTGVAKLGFSFDSSLPPQAEVVLATVTFEKLSAETAALSFFDVRDEGHTQVLAEVEGKLWNVLDTKNLEAVFSLQ